MSHDQSIAASELFTKLVLTSRVGEVAEIPSYGLDFVATAVNNPLLALRLMTTDPETEGAIESDDAARVLGVPVEWFDCEFLNAPMDRLLPALGAIALMWLSSLRSNSLRNVFGLNIGEDILGAVEAQAERMALNAKLRRMSE